MRLRGTFVVRTWPSRPPFVAPVRVHGDGLTVHLTGTARQVDDEPINMPLLGTVDCAFRLTIRSIPLDSAMYCSVSPYAVRLTRCRSAR